MPLLNSGNSKTRKGERLGWITFGLHLAPHTLSGFNVCQHASAGCAAACLNTAGRGAMSSVQRARIAKTRFFFEDRPTFMAELHKEIETAIRKAERKQMTPCFRLNLTSDIPWELIKHDEKTLMRHFPNVSFYDYTKSFRRMEQFLMGGLPSNYHLTFSRSECNEREVNQVIARGGNVAVVFRNRLPQAWNGREVVNGDETDLRFLDPRGVIVGLVEKGKAKVDNSGFVLQPC